MRNQFVRFDFEPAQDPVDPHILASEICACLNAVLILPDYADIATMLWIAHTFVIEPASEPQVIDRSPLLLVTSPDRQCGKSTLRYVLEELVARARATSNLSDAVLYRIMEAEQPTLLIDEADTFLKERKGLTGLINDGYTPSGNALRIGGSDFNQLEVYSSWGAKAIFGIGDLPETIESRSIKIQMRRKRKDETVIRLNHYKRANPEIFSRLRSQLLRFVIDYKDAIAGYYPVLPDGLDDREEDNWETLLKVAHAFGPVWEQHAREAAVALSRGANPIQSQGEQLLEDLMQLFAENGADRLASGYIVRRLNDDETRSWGDFNRGNGLTPRDLAAILRRYGVYPQNVRTKGGIVKGYLMIDLKDQFSRYLETPATALHDPSLIDKGHSEEEGLVHPSLTHRVPTGDRSTPGHHTNR